MKTKLWMMTAGVALLFAGSAAAQMAAEPKGDHPVIKPYPKSLLQKGESEWRENFSWAFNVTNAETDETETKTVQGKYWRLTYVVIGKVERKAPEKPAAPQPSADAAASSGEEEDPAEARAAASTSAQPAELESEPVAGPEKNEAVTAKHIAEHYLQFAQEKNARIVYDDVKNGALTFVLSDDAGSKTWCHVEAGAGEYGLWIMDERSNEKRLTFNASQIKKTLDAAGRVALYGVYFESGKSSLKTQSFATLQELVKLCRAYPDLALEVQCHTDNQGDETHNLEMSKQRAENVKSFLVLFGVDSARITAQGCGGAQPIASNDAEEGRAQNRRVEIVKQK